MKILAALVLLSVAAGEKPAEQVKCRQTILCPCGNTGENVTVCAEEENVCSKWSKCKACRDGLDGCLECPEGSEGLSCLKGSEKLSRQKRQYFMYPNGGGRRPLNGPLPSPPQSERRGGCPELNSPKLGSIRCLFDDRQRACVGRCLPGYSFEGRESEIEITLTCRGDHYTPLREFPPCKSGGHCDLEVRGSGSFNCTTGMGGTRCDVFCSGRYMGRYSCFPREDWKPPLPYCALPKDVEDFRQTCRCENGGRCDNSGNCVCPSGRTGRFCEKTVPERRTCRDPGFVENGLRKNPDETESKARQSFAAMESVVYSCVSEGYALQGSSLLTCKNDGTWSSPLPTCRGIPSPQRMATCRDPGVPPNARRIPRYAPSQGFEPGSGLEYSCYDGYELDGEKNIFCLTSGRWSSERPTCKAEPRVTVSPPGTGNYCQDPGIDPNGGRNLPSTGRRRFLEGSRLEYFCNTDYDIDGDRSILCLASGRWSSQRPTCKPKPRRTVCLNPGPMTNGRIVYYPPINRRQGGRPQVALDDPEYPVGAYMLYSCTSGYTLQGTDSLTCGESGEWSAEPPVCIKDDELVTCANPGSISNGRFVYYPPMVRGERGQPSSAPDISEYPVGGLLLYSCDSGYYLQGSSLTCRETGEWSSEPPTCVKEIPESNERFCPDPGVDPNGSRTPRLPPNRRGFPHRTRLKYSCNQGYEIDGENVLFCLPSGDWLSAVPKIPKCLPQNPITDFAYCSNPGPIANGRVVYYPSLGNRRVPDANLEGEEFPEGGRLRYSCSSGFTLQGSEFLTCQSDGRWSTQPPVCTQNSPRGRLNYCDNPGPIPNGKVEYVPATNERNPRPPDTIEEEYFEYPQGSRLVYSCDIGYTLHGTAELKCEETGVWSDQTPGCMTSDVKHILYCLNPGPILNGKIRYYLPIAGPRSGSTTMVAEDTPEYPEGTTLEYECDEGYILEGTVTLHCESTGLWSSPTPPTCEADCGRSMAGTTRKILHGNKTVVGEWPWVVAIAVRENNLPRIVCGGAVLNTRTVITAAHCVNSGERYYLYFGKYYRSDKLDDDQVQVARSERVIRYPEYNNVTYDSDIALIKFKPKIKYNNRVQPICLPNAKSTIKNINRNNKGYVTGWGENENQLDSDELMMAYLPVHTNDDCRESFRVNAPTFNPVLSENNFCAGFPEAQQSTCRGDSGSPFVFYDPLTQRHTIEGIVSFTVQGQCGLPGRYSVYTKVQRFLHWIYRNMS